MGRWITCILVVVGLLSAIFLHGSGDVGGLVFFKPHFAFEVFEKITLSGPLTPIGSETLYFRLFGAFGMGYATESDKTWRDELFIANKNELAKVDPISWNVETIGDLPSQSELTGNADGELWAFLPLENPAALAKLDKTTGLEMDRVSIYEFPNPANIDTFAFATWGGDFWLFVRSYGMGESTDVFRVTEAGDITKVRNNVGLNIVGAGVSTCAPTE